MAGLPRLWWVFFCFFALVPRAQTEDGDLVQTRAGQIQAERLEKARTLPPEQVSSIHRIIREVRERRLVQRVTAGVAGFRLLMGGLGPGSGFAVGTEYFRPDLAHDQVLLRGSISGSPEDFFKTDLQLGLPRLAGGRAFLNFHAFHQNSPRIDYYGPGPDSAVTGRTIYALEDTWFSAAGGLRPARHVSVGGLARFLLVNAGPGRNGNFASSDRVFSPASVPGLERQSDFLITGAFAEYDSRDIPGGPRNGGRYRVEFANYADRDLRLQSFHRIDFEAQHYFSFLNDRRVIALRGKTTLTGAREGNSVPFYLQPQLGGAMDLRGFRARRFYGDNLLALNAEYRWEVFSGLDMALFADAGKVFPRRSQLNLHDLETSQGFGFRLNSNNSVFLRIDLAFSREGPQLWVTFENVF